ncbi:MAG: GNAT family N-acetyltransferase [Planctomycetaceae bacterium]
MWVASRPSAGERLEEWSFVIVDPADRLLGGCGLHRISQRGGVAELGYWVRTSATRKGVATRATRLLCDWGFQSQGLHRIEIVVDLDNQPSRRVAEKAGGIHEGTLRERLRQDNVWRDAALYSILSSDVRT